MRSLWLVPYARITVRTDVPETMRDYLLERPARFPGVSVDRTFLRRYPEGHVGGRSWSDRWARSARSELKEQRFRGVIQGTVVGKGGLERTYDRYLRGIDGSTRITVDALGGRKGAGAGREARVRPLHAPVAGPRPAAGRRDRRWLARSPPRRASPGAFVALDPRNGKVLAMGSDPTLRPLRPGPPDHPGAASTRCSASRPARRWSTARSPASTPPARRSSRSPRWPAWRRACGRPTRPIVDDACVRIGEQERCNARKQAYGTVALRRALQVSSDVYFYTLGRDLNPIAGQPLQRWARRLGLRPPDRHRPARRVGGTIPDRAWRDQRNRLEARCRRERARAVRHRRRDEPPVDAGRQRQPRRRPGRPPGHAAADGRRLLRDRQRRPRPAPAPGRRHRGRQRPAAAGAARRPGARRVKIDPAARQRDHGRPAPGDQRPTARRRPSSPAGTSAPSPSTARPAPPRPRGATSPGTCCYVPDQSRPIVIAVTVEQGGFGAEAAAPAARYMLGAVVRPEEDLRRVLPPTGTPSEPSRHHTAARRRGRAAAHAVGRAAAGAALPFDPVLLLAVLGLCICSLVTLAYATQRRRRRPARLLRPAPGRLLRDRRASLAIVVSRVDYSRLRELAHRRSTGC